MSTEIIVQDIIAAMSGTNGFVDRYHVDKSEGLEHMKTVVRDIVKTFIKVRLHHIAKQSTLNLAPTTVRSTCTKQVIFYGH